MTIKEALHRLVDELPEAELPAAKRYLEYLRNVGADPVLRSLMEAPVDDEPLTPEEEAAVAEAYEDLRCGRTVTMEEVKRELGL